jgi:predicted RNA binding protein YcfA (HicA-like mRNA interferase family)
MSSQHPPLTYKDVIRGLKKLGFIQRPKTATTHEQCVKTKDGRFYKVTVDFSKSPYSHDLIKSMASQAGVSKKDFYDACLG